MLRRSIVLSNAHRPPIPLFLLSKFNPISTAAAGTGADCANSAAAVLTILSPHRHQLTASNHHVSSLRRCLKSKNPRTLPSLHAHLHKLGFTNNLFISNVILNTYVKLGNLDSARNLFDEMPHRDHTTYCALISGFANIGLNSDSFKTFRNLLRDGLLPNCYVISSVLNACSGTGIPEFGMSVHGVVVKLGLGFDKFVEVGIVSMYGKCGCLDEARKMFGEAPVKCIEVWNAVISGFFVNGLFGEVVEVCKKMCRVGFVMDLVSLRVASAAVSEMGMFELCGVFYCYCVKIGLDGDSFVVAELVKLLFKIGEVDCVHELCRRVKSPDLSLYSLLILGYDKFGYRERAVGFAKELIGKKSSPLEGGLIGVVGLCIFKEEGMQIHTHLMKSGCLSSVNVGNALMSMYFGFGETEDSKRFFDDMEVCDIVSWTTIMAGLVHNQQFTDAILAFLWLHRAGIRLDQHSVATVAGACTALDDMSKGEQVHSLSLKLGLVCSDYVNASILDLYAKCGFIDSAVRLFSFSTFPHALVGVNAMLAGYCWNFQPKNALNLFQQERQLGLIPDHFSYSIVLGACADIRSKDIGEQVHCCITKSGFEFTDIIIGNAMVNLYVKSGCISNACKYFYSMKARNSSSYTILMLGYGKTGNSAEALKLFYQMNSRGLCANPLAFLLILRGCIDSATIYFGRQVHAMVIKMGLVLDATISDELVHLYAKSVDIVGPNKISAEVLVRKDSLGLKHHVENAPLIKEKEKTKQMSPDDYSFVLDEILQRDMLLWNIVHSANRGSAYIFAGS